MPISALSPEVERIRVAMNLLALMSGYRGGAGAGETIQ